MNFFEHQDQARRSSRRLVVLFALAVLCIVAAVDAALVVTAMYVDGTTTSPVEWARAHPLGLAMATLVTLTVIGGGSLARLAGLRAGGGAVAERLGGRRLEPGNADPRYARLLNVVEEMAVASGVPVPEVYVLPDEDGINAFAAGLTPGDAAVAVTAGCLEQLDRDQLQGVIAHEFSHVLHGDMYLNVRLMGVLFGILLIGVVGRTLLYGVGRTRVSRSRDRGNAGTAILVLAVALLAIGYIGVFFGRLIQAGVSRQREFLADASAVQFTRNPLGIGGALKKIGSFASGSRLQSPRAEEVGHMLFGSWHRSFVSWLATHPPLAERIGRIDPRFRPAETAAAAGAGALTPEGVVQLVGRPSAEHVRHAAGLLREIPAGARGAAASPAGARALICALLLAPEGDARSLQLEALERAGVDVELVLAEVKSVRPDARLALASLVAPALRHQSGDEVAELRALLETLIHADARVDPFEYALAKVVEAHLEDATARRAPAGRVVIADRVRDVHALLAVLATAGSADRDGAQAAFDAGVARLPRARIPAYAPPADWMDALDAALPRLVALAPSHKSRLVEALTATIAHDARVTLRERELLRAVCETLRCPLPPLLD